MSLTGKVESIIYPGRAQAMDGTELVLSVDNEHFLYFNWAGNMLSGETVFLSFKLLLMGMPELEGKMWVVRE